MSGSVTASVYDSVRLGDVASVRSGFAFKSSDWAESGIPVVKIANVKNGSLRMEGCSFVPQPVADSATEAALREGDILIAMTGYIGQVAIVRDRDLPAALNQRVGRFKVLDPERLDQVFLFYVLRSVDTRQEIEDLGYGSAQPNVSPSLIHSVEIPLPPLREQRAIAHLLSRLDDKIELNQRVGETLEAIVTALFKSWFVNFEPVRAKAEGRDPGVPKSVAELFPRRFAASALGPIPAGWEIVELQDAFEIADGRTMPASRRQIEGRYEVFGANGVIGRTDEVSVNSPCVVLGKIGSCGSLHRSVGPSWVTNNAFAILPGRSLSLEFAWSVLREIDFSQFVGGSANPYMPLKNFGHYRIVRPSMELLIAFEQHAGAIRGRMEVGHGEISTIARLRDALLPKLISGELRVSPVVPG
jgi:type I restriction enzyme S subunit